MGLIDAYKAMEDIDEIACSMSVCINSDFYHGMTAMKDAAIHAVERQPTVQAVPVVRCKDCLYHTDAYPYDEEDELIPSNAVFCRHFEVIRDKNWFCADGERRSE